MGSSGRKLLFFSATTVPEHNQPKRYHRPVAVVSSCRPHHTESWLESEGVRAVQGERERKESALMFDRLASKQARRGCRRLGVVRSASALRKLETH